MLNLQEPLKSVSAQAGLCYVVEKGRLSEQDKKLLIVSTRLSCPCSDGNLAAGAIALADATSRRKIRFSQVQFSAAGWNPRPAVLQQHLTRRLGKPKHRA